MRMLESIVDLLNDLFLIAVIVLMVFSIVGSIVAALRAVSGGPAPSTGRQRKFVGDVRESPEGLLNPKNLRCDLPTAFSSRIGPEKARSCPGGLNFFRQGKRKPRKQVHTRFDQAHRC
jgi:hypothetical protein